MVIATINTDCAYCKYEKMYTSEYDISFSYYKNSTHNLLSPSGFTKFKIETKFFE
jgi:hypothetical protein